MSWTVSTFLSLVLGCLALAACLVVAVLGYLWLCRLRTSVPGAPTVPLLGNIRPPFRFPNVLQELRVNRQLYGDTFRFYLLSKLFILTSRPEDARKILASTKTRERDPYFTFFFRTLVSDGLITTTGDTWKRHRKTIEPAFHAEVITQLIGTFNKSACFLCDKLAESAGAMVDLYPILMTCVTRTIMKAIFGVELDRLEPDQRKHSRITAIKKMSVIIFRPWKLIKGFMWMSAEGRAVKKQSAYFRNLVKRGLALASENMKDNGITPLVRFLSEQKTGHQLTEEEICNEIHTLAVSGVETTATALGFALALLALHPEWQDLAQKQLDDVFCTGGNDYLRPATTEDLSQLTVIDAIIKETLRLYPSVPHMPRLVAEDTPLCGGRHVAPRGSSVMVSLLLMHRRPDLFPDPDQFDPGRFLPGGSATHREPGSYLPFGSGPRMCVGARFAELEMKVMLATVLRRFRILPGSTREQLEQIPLAVTAHPRTGYRVSCVPRDNVAVAS